ncbi:hypothetical protein GGX14DRAFT_677316 [Mycena pura]|uniref:Uncharacterized protein n=1 Tax=Mycena pura TaxID=153505 RepID=A0AAD6UUY1_9AGAR|nr:hypothetical protein GGX14DRAFT_677316 [Mycena pura]
MVQHSRQLLFLSLFAACLVSLFAIGFGEPVKRTVETDIATMAAQITGLDSVIDKLSAIGIISPTDAVGVHSAAVALGTTIDLATSDVTVSKRDPPISPKAAGPVDEDDGKSILSSIQGFVPNIQDILTKLANGTAITAIVKFSLQWTMVSHSVAVNGPSFLRLSPRDMPPKLGPCFYPGPERNQHHHTAKEKIPRSLFGGKVANPVGKTHHKQFTQEALMMGLRAAAESDEEPDYGALSGLGDNHEV